LSEGKELNSIDCEEIIGHIVDSGLRQMGRRILILIDQH
jgi:hypothetical protein